MLEIANSTSGSHDVEERMLIDDDALNQMDDDDVVRFYLWLSAARLKHGEIEAAIRLQTAAADRAGSTQLGNEVASALVSLSKALIRKDVAAERVVEVEALLCRAVRLAPKLAIPALAVLIQRQGRLSEACDLWREAVRLVPDVSAHYFSLARLQEQAGQATAAIATYLALIEASPTHRNYLTVADRLRALTPIVRTPDRNRTLKVALVGSATMDHIRSYLAVECYRAGLTPDMYLAGFDQYSQEILDPASGMYTFEPDVVICAIHASRLFPRLSTFPFDLSVAERREEIQSGLNIVRGLLETLSRHSRAMILFHNVVAPQRPALGIQDLRDDLGQTEIFAEINQCLARMIRDDFQGVHMVDEDRVQSQVGKSAATDPRHWYTARLGWSEAMLSALSREYLRYLRPLKGVARKCIVVDLDNTLWGGVIGEDGLGGIQLGPDAPGNAFVDFQRALEVLWRRGVLLAVCSKNNPEDALQGLDHHPSMVLRSSHFAASRINWRSKSANIRDIAAELNIGLDSLVFLDDNPVERAEVRAVLPQVLTPEFPSDPAQYRQFLLDLGVFDTLSLTTEDLVRNRLYTEQRARHEAEAQMGGSLEDFLQSLQLEVTIAPANTFAIARVAQLTNKTNQFNLTTRRYSEANIGELVESSCRVFAMRVNDRFGDQGLVGVAITRPDDRATWEIDTFLLSCRVMGRGVESAMLAHIADQARHSGVHRLRGSYIPTGNNIVVEDFYDRHGFMQVEVRPDGGSCWELDLEQTHIEPPAWVTIHGDRPPSA